MSTAEIAIKVENLSKCYHVYDKPRDRLLQMLSFGRKQYFREFWALRDVSFEIKKGETVGIIGRNGSGKSTLLQMICGTLNPTGGSIQANGRIAALLELGSGFNAEFTGRENVYLNGTLLGLSKQEIDNRFSDIEAFAEIGDFIDQPVKTYSSGMFVRLAFAIQANVDPEILIVDEALAVGDAYFVHRCMARFHDLQRLGTTIIFVSHDASSVKRLCNRVLWLNDGRLKQSGDSMPVVDAYIQEIFDLEVTKFNKKANFQDDINATTDDEFNKKLFLPIGDGRFGERNLEVVGMFLGDENGLPTNVVNWDENICLLIKIKNNNLRYGHKIGCGYILRDNKGIEIASTSSWLESFDIPAPGQGDNVIVLIKISIPKLYPGNYSLTPSVSLINNNDNLIIQDRIFNAFVFEVTTSQQIFTPIRLNTNFSILNIEEVVKYFRGG